MIKIKQKSSSLATPATFQVFESHIVASGLCTEKCRVGHSTSHSLKRNLHPVSVQVPKGTVDEKNSE